ncbi:hypothetical protein MD484_g5952, partial [Candolleomyces efflorescens]
MSGSPTKNALSCLYGARLPKHYTTGFKGWLKLQRDKDPGLKELDAFQRWMKMSKEERAVYEAKAQKSSQSYKQAIAFRNAQSSGSSSGSSGVTTPSKITESSDGQKGPRDDWVPSPFPQPIINRTLRSAASSSTLSEELRAPDNVDYLFYPSQELMHRNPGFDHWREQKYPNLERDDAFAIWLELPARTKAVYDAQAHGAYESPKKAGGRPGSPKKAISSPKAIFPRSPSKSAGQTVMFRNCSEAQPKMEYMVCKPYPATPSTPSGGQPIMHQRCKT